jgi:putative ABC transport system permease protein
MTSILTEVRQSAGRLAGSPGYSIGILLTLTLGLALSVGMYTVLKGVILNGLPYPGGERIVEIGSTNARQNETDGALTAAEALALVDDAAFEHSGWYLWGGETVLDGERPREVTTNYVSAGFFPVLGMPAQLGRWLDAEDMGPNSRAVVLSDLEWQRLTDRDPGVIGKDLKLASETVTVVGVMPPEFAYPSRDVGLWRAVNTEWYTRDPASFVGSRYLMAVGRLAAGVDAERATLALDALSVTLRDTYGLADDGWRMRTTGLLDVTVGDVRAVLASVFVVSLVVLAIACANAGSLLAARLAVRERELAIVQALGATPGRVWRGVLFELLLLAVAASVVAMLVLLAGLGAFRLTAAGILPRVDEIGLDPAVLAFAALLALLCPLLVAAPFGLRLKRRMAGNLQASGKGTGDAPRRGLHVLPVMGLALATAALIAGAAVALSLDQLRRVDPGFQPQGLYAVQVFHRGGPEEWRRFAREVLARMSAEPDVGDVALTTISPLAQGGKYRIDVKVPGRDQPEAWQAVLQRVSPAYLDVIGQPLVLGRDLLPTDDETAPNVAIVSETFARRVFGTLDVVDREVALPLGEGPRVRFRIVGVTADTRNATVRGPGEPEILVPFIQSPWVGVTFLARAPHAGSDLLTRMHEAVWAVDPQEAISRASLVHEDLEAQLALTIFFTRMLGGFALLALSLAAFGTYSVIAFLQRRQTREIGVRLALGAEPLDVARRVLVQGITLAAFAGVAGSLAAIAVLRLLGSQLFGVGAASPALYALGIGGVLLAALLASVAPAWRAARVQPMAALRCE